MSSDLTTAAHALLEALPSPTRGEDPSTALTQRLHRRLTGDVLPRLDAQAPLLLVALAGPNNVGKSTLFNTLAGRPLSPARAEGGLTRQCLAAVHPEGDTRALAEALGRRYEVVRVGDGQPAPVDVSGPPGRLYLTQAPLLPRGLVLMDTPDFDSVFSENRVATEALLVTADVVLFVVSRQTYQNAALVDFVKGAVGAGRPWLVLYNEASREEIATDHLATLARQVGHPPVATYLAAHQPEVEDGAPLRLRAMGDAPPLQELLGAPERAAGLKRLALGATLEDALREARELAALEDAKRAEPDRLRRRIRHELERIGRSAAIGSIPADAVLAAFRQAMDRNHPFHRAVRVPARALTQGLSLVGKGLRRVFTGPEPEPAPMHDEVQVRLREGVQELLEQLAYELHSWRGDPEGAALLEALLDPSARTPEVPSPSPGERRVDEARFTEECRSLFLEVLPQGGRGQLLQSATTFLYAIPATAAAAVSIATGGLGQDVAIWVGSLLTAPLFERFVDMMGAGVRQQVVEAWAQRRGTTLAGHLEATRFSALLHHLDTRAEQAEQAARSLRKAADTLAHALTPAPETPLRPDEVPS